MPTAAAMIMSPLAVAASNIDEPLVGSASVSEVGAVVSEGGGSEDPQPLQCKFFLAVLTKNLKFVLKNETRQPCSPCVMYIIFSFLLKKMFM